MESEDGVSVEREVGAMSSEGAARGENPQILDGDTYRARSDGSNAEGQDETSGAAALPQPFHASVQVCKCTRERAAMWVVW